MMKKKTWQEFRDAGLLWWVNRLLCLFGWCIVFDMDDNDNILDVFPARTKYRGFTDEAEKDSISIWSAYMGKNAGELFIDDIEGINKYED